MANGFASYIGEEEEQSLIFCGGWLNEPITELTSRKEHVDPHVSEGVKGR